MSNIKIAIDGPAGAGKSTIAKYIAEKLQYTYIDTGAMYRAVGFFALQNNLAFDEASLNNVIDKIDIDIFYLNGKQHIKLLGEDITDKIRSQQVSMAASDVAKIKSVRLKLVEIQRKLAEKYNVIMDGRDIGTYVLPDAQIKIFLTADVADRAKRRYDELIQKGDNVTFDYVLEDMKKRDYNDSNREFAPLRKAEDAVEVETTGFELDKSIEIIYSIIIDKIGNIQIK